MKKLFILIMTLVTIHACAQLPTVVIPDGTTPEAFLDSMENILNRQNDSIDLARNLTDLNFSFIEALRDSVDSLRYDIGTGGGGGGGTYTAGSGMTLDGSAFELGGSISQATQLIFGNYLFEIKSNSGTGSTSRRIQMDTGEGLYLDYYEDNDYTGGVAGIALGGSVDNASAFVVYDTAPEDGTRFLLYEDSLRVEADSIIIEGPLSFLDSVYLKYSNAPWDTILYVGADPNTYALYIDTTSNTSFGLTMPIEPISEFMSDVVNGELKWYYKHGNEIVFARGWTTSPGDRQEQVGVMIERNLRYTLTNDRAIYKIRDGMKIRDIIIAIQFLLIIMLFIKTRKR